MKLLLAEYLLWHLDHFGEDLNSDEVRRSFSANLTLAQAGINGHVFVRECAARLNGNEFNDVFSLSTGARAVELAFQLKSYQSVIDKTYRLNCHWNREFPNRPRGGWVKASNWFRKIDDLVRTNLVCRYIDGPEIVSRAIVEEAQRAGLQARYHPRATDQGYYAFHCYANVPVDLIEIGGGVSETAVAAEIHVTTQLQEVLRNLTHTFYRERRVGDRMPVSEERWDFESAQFRASYLGHTLHLIEGMIVQLRDEAQEIGQ